MKISPAADPLIRFLHVQCEVNAVSRKELARRSGVGETTLKAWWSGGRRGGSPSLHHIRCALAVFDYDLKPTPIGHHDTHK